MPGNPSAYLLCRSEFMTSRASGLITFSDAMRGIESLNQELCFLVKTLTDWAISLGLGTNSGKQ